MRILTLVFMSSIVLFMLNGCGSDKDSKPTELEGVWESNCALTLKTIADFEGDSFILELVSHETSDCDTIKNASTLMEGTFKIGGSVDEPAGAKKLDLKTSKGTLYTIFKLSGSTLNFTVTGEGANDGSSDSKRIKTVPDSPMTKI